MFRFLTALTLVTLTALVLAYSSFPAYAATDWEQVGVDIDGEANGNQSGYSVSLSNATRNPSPHHSSPRGASPVRATGSSIETPRFAALTG